jgi:hypothetical protein
MSGTTIKIVVTTESTVSEEFYRDYLTKLKLAGVPETVIEELLVKRKAAWMSKGDDWESYTVYSSKRIEK